MRLSRDLVGHFPGGLAQVNVVLSIFFAGISGSSTADAASQSKIFIEAQGRLRRQLLGRGHRLLGGPRGDHPALDPDDRLGRAAHGLDRGLFLAGIIPGLLIGLAQMATVHAYAVRRGYPTYPRATLVETLKAIGVAIPALMTPIIIIGGKIFGWFTATESACIAVLYAVR